MHNGVVSLRIYIFYRRINSILLAASNLLLLFQFSVVEHLRFWYSPF
jgi:hypothetical protein